MSEQEPSDRLTRDTLGGVSWAYAGTVVGALTQLAYTATMGRLLEPADFGLVAMALVVQRFGSYFAQMGVGRALIQKSDLDVADVRVGVTTSVLLGLFVGGAMVAAAPLAGLFFDTDAVTPVVRVLALSFVLSSLGHIATSLLRRELRFRALSIIEVTAQAVAFLGVGIGMALLGFGVWSLVGAQLALSLLETGLAYAVRRHSLVPLLTWYRARALYSYGSRISVISFFEFIGSSLDTLVIGRWSGQQALGHYNRALLLVNLPFQQVVKGLSGVLFPAFSRIQGDIPRLRGAYRSGLGMVAAFLMPTAAGLAVAAPELVRVVLGPQWNLAAVVVPALAIAGTVNFLSHLGGVVCDATATLNRKLVLQIAYVLVLGGLLFVAGTQDQLIFFAFAVAGAQVFRHVLYMALLRRVLGFGIGDHLRIYGPVLAAAVLVGGCLTAVTLLLRPLVPVGIVLAGQVATGVLVMMLSLLWGPLVGTRRDVRVRLEMTGLLEGGSRLSRVVRAMMDLGR